MVPRQVFYKCPKCKKVNVCVVGCVRPTGYEFCKKCRVMMKVVPKEELEMLDLIKAAFSKLF